MARTSNAAMLERLRGKIALSKNWRHDEKYDDLWKRMIDLYRGKHFQAMSREDRMLVNMAFSTINVVVPSVSVNNPKFTVNARVPDDAPQAIITEAVLNYNWRAHRFQQEFKAAVKDSRIVGHGWIKVTYKFVAENPEPTRTEGDTAALGEPLEFTGEYSDEAIDGNVASTELTICEDRPVVERVSPFDVFVDPDATSMSNMKWIAQRVRRHIGDVRNDKRYKPSARAKVSPTSGSKFADDQRANDRDNQDGYVEVWEFYDIAKGVVAVFADTGDEFLIAPQKIPFAMGHPFVMVPAYTVPEHFYPLGDLEAIETLQLELNETRTQMMNHRKKFARKWLYKEKFFDPRGVELLRSPDDNVMVPVIGDTPLGDVIQAMPAVISPADFYNQSQIIQADIERVSGVSDYQRGAAPDIRRTATEAGIMADAANARTADALGQIETSLAEIAERVIGLMQQFMTGEQVARVAGRNSTSVWVKYDVDYIRGQFDYEVEAGSTQPNNESFRRQTALQMVDALAPFADIINQEELVKYLLQFGFGVKDPERFVAPPPPDPAQSSPAPMSTSDGTLPDGMMPGGAMPMGMAPPMPSQMSAQLPPQMPVGGDMQGPMSMPPEVLAQFLAQNGGGLVPPM